MCSSRAPSAPCPWPTCESTLRMSSVAAIAKTPSENVSSRARPIRCIVPDPADSVPAVERVPITSDAVPPPASAYSHGLRVGDLVFLAGQGGFDPQTRKLGETIEEQTEQTLRTIEQLLEASGCSRADVV